ncbi:coenzyme F420-0:L-glutamate ligase [Candidatus Nitrosocosmicus hydrocola]|uniref:coenzyme F420-0:L-glutamate ligase n=1 Tax=Candidatus Nitrosocosmicus hydrocola TaxID=1826872 RepID=UPI000A8A31E3|nr:coenzyme F420-0:L-glutamate ligase [Candidatus Nitrosocosmicus hydrocola]
MLSIIPVAVSEDIRSGQNLTETIIGSIRLCGLAIEEYDILVIAQKIISKSETRIVDMQSILPSDKAVELARVHDKDPRLIQLVLNESKSIVRLTKRHIIAKTKHGFICANAGIDQSNVSKDPKYVLLLPENPDESARKLRKDIFETTKKNVSVIVSDTFGRPFRNGQTNVAIGISGMNPLKSYIGTADQHGRELKVTEIAIADEIASAAELVMGKTLQIPVAIVRGYKYEFIHSDLEKKIGISILIRSEKDDLFMK